MLLKDTIIDLCGLSAPSGFEDSVFDRAKAFLSPYADDIRTDAMGNLIAVRKCGRPNAKTLMFDAHIDEIGLIVTGIEKGFLRFSGIGGVDPRMLPARELKLLTEPPIFGVIDTLPPHVLSSGDMDKAIDPEKLFIDVGLSEEAAEKRIPLGTPAVYAGGIETLNGSVICGKSLDDRSCVAILLQLMKRLSGEDLSVDVCCLLSTQEELGMRGAAAGVYGIDPDYAIVLDVTFAAAPDFKGPETLELRRGAAIGIGPGMDRGLTKALIKIAGDKGIPYQLEVMGGDSGTNDRVIQVCREGVVTGLVSLPIRYMHSPVELMDISDAEALVELLTEFTLWLDKGELS
ncbi:MAG: M42 family peptidase [Oscillospiraceae bacterium]|jgi:endoglucanase|nr:M42 family peptidase [Oscillospiraceae bacterium]